MFNINTYKALAVSSLLCIALNSHAQVHVLFDATKAEMAGNADWVIDADTIDLKYHPNAYLSASGEQSNPQRYPTPDQSTVTASTPETYWKGALSAWGIDCVKQGYKVETLPYNGSITYGIGTNLQDLSHYDVFIIDEPNIQFTATEKTALLNFVSHGGGLFIISDHDGSDRNFDGWDSPHIWNDLFTNNGSVTNPFGIAFDLLDFSQTSSNVVASATDPIIHGPIGNATSVKWSDGTTMTLDPTANSTVKGVVFKTGSAAGNTNVMFAYARYGSGKIAAMGDSSPADDGTGNPYSTALYSSYTGEVSGHHRSLLMNATIWLATKATAVSSIAGISAPVVSVYPNPSSGAIYVDANDVLNNALINVYDITGKLIASQTAKRLDKNEKVTFSLSKGFYLVKLESDEVRQSNKVIIQ